MHVLRNHFKGKPTILINDWVINGCTMFKMEDAPAILEEHEVPAEVWQQVLDVYTGVSTPEQIESFKNDPHWRVRLEVVRLGLYPEHFKDDPNWRIRIKVAKLGLYPEQFKDDPDEDVREEAARHISVNR